jgi:hypothetical protein
MGQPGADSTVLRLSPRIRSSVPATDGIASIPFHLIEPFLNEAVIFETNQLASAPRIVAAQEGSVLLSRGSTAYVRGDLGSDREFRIFREPRALKDPTTAEILGYEASYVGAAEYVREGETRAGADGKPESHPGDIRADQHPPGSGHRRPAQPGSGPRVFELRTARLRKRLCQGRSSSIYGEALTAGQNQIVSLNRGARDGMERGHVLALLARWRPLDRQDRPDSPADETSR